MSFNLSQKSTAFVPCGKASFTSGIDFNPKQDVTMDAVAGMFGAWLKRDEDKELHTAAIAKALQNSRSV